MFVRAGLGDSDVVRLIRTGLAGVGRTEANNDLVSLPFVAFPRLLLSLSLAFAFAVSLARLSGRLLTTRGLGRVGPVETLQDLDHASGTQGRVDDVAARVRLEDSVPGHRAHLRQCPLDNLADGILFRLAVDRDGRVV